MELSINNFRSIAEKNYVFPNGNTLISGESGSGKSTILESIIWCFYGGSNVTPFIQEKGKKITTKVIVKINNLVITRTKPPDKCQIILGNNKKLEHSEAQEYINNFFGSKSLWETSCYLKQDCRSNLLFSSGQEKYSLIKEIIFGNESSKSSPESYLEKLLIYSKNMDANITSMEGKIEIMEQNTNEMINDLESFQELSKDEEKMKKLQSKYDYIVKCIERLQIKIAGLDTFRKNQDRLKVLEEELKNYPELTMEKIERWKTWKDSKEKLSDYMPYEKIECEDTVESLQLDINFLERDRIKYKKNRDKCKELNVPYEESEVDKIIEKSSEEISRIESYKNYSNIMKNIRKIEESISNTENLIEKLEQKEEPYRKGFELILKKLGIEDGDYSEEKINQIKRKISTILTDYLKCPHCNKNTVLEEGKLVIKKCHFMTKEELQKLEKNIKNIVAFYEKKKDLFKRLENYRSMKDEMDIPEEVEEVSGDINILKNYISELNCLEFIDYDEEDFLEKKKILEKLKRQEHVKVLETRIEKNLDPDFELFDAPSNFSSYFVTYRKLISEKELLLTNLEEISEETEEDLSDKLDKLKDTLVKLDNFKIYQNIKDKQKKLEEMRESYSADVKKRGSCHTLKKIIEEESSLTFENMILNFNDTLNDIVAEIFEDITIELGMFKKLKAKGELKPQFNMKVILKGNEYDNLNFLSGGEKDRISIALTLTLSTLINNPVIMFDESMSSLDEEMRERCLELIKKYAGDKILINICHSTVEGYYDTIIRK